MANETEWPTTTRSLHDQLRRGMDWIDVLLAVGTVAVLYAVVGRVFPWLAATPRYALVAFGPVIGRRMIFGVPDRGVMRTGALWSALGLVGMMSLLLGAATASFGIWGLASMASETEPDWPTVIRAERANGLHISVVEEFAGDSPEARAQREKAEAERQQAREEASLVAEVPVRHAEWLQSRSRSTRMHGAVIGAGLALVALGALLDRARFQREAAQKP